MSFAQYLNAEIQHLAPLFGAAEEADMEFHEAWKDGLIAMGFRKYKQTERYGETLERFVHACKVIDAIMETALAQAKLGDLSQLPRLFAYISLPGQYFRSGYRRSDIWRFLKQLPLDEEQSAILRGIILRQVETAGPEFKEVSRAAHRVDSAELREHLNILRIRSGKDYVRQRAKRLLAALEASSM